MKDDIITTVIIFIVMIISGFFGFMINETTKLPDDVKSNVLKYCSQGMSNEVCDKTIQYKMAEENLKVSIKKETK